MLKILHGSPGSGTPLNEQDIKGFLDNQSSECPSWNGRREWSREYSSCWVLLRLFK